MSAWGVLTKAVKANRFVFAHAAALRSRRPVANVLCLRRNLLFAKVVQHTLVSYDRLLNTLDLAQRVQREELGGAYVECGVWRGGTAALLAMTARAEGKGRVSHLFDSFEGLPTPTVHDMAHRSAGTLLDGPPPEQAELKPTGLYVATLKDVSHYLFDELRLDRAQVRLHKGWFQHTLPAARAAIGPIAILRIDADWYESVKTCLENLYDNVVTGGYVIMDDYGTYPGCRQAYQEFAAAIGLEARLHAIDDTGVWFQKPAIEPRQRAPGPLAATVGANGGH